jgi:hypothetical protein
MLDIKWIRENPEALDAALAKRGAEPLSASLIALDEKRRSAVQKVQDMQSRRNTLLPRKSARRWRRRIASLPKSLKAEVADLKVLLPSAEEDDRKYRKSSNDALSRIPNVPHDDVPVGKDENDNVVARVVGEKPRWNHTPKEHFEIGEALGYMDFERPAKLSGSRFTVLTGPLARSGARARPVHDRSPHERARLHRSQFAADGACRGAVRHRQPAEVRGRSLQDDRWPLPHPDRGSDAHQPGARGNSRSGKAAAALHRA